MKQIRKSVFETNSSSVHTLSVESGNLTSRIPTNTGVCTIYQGEFGWGVDSYTDAATKAAYCWTHVDKYANGDSGRLREMLEKVLLKHTKADRIEFASDPEAYIDHQSVGTCDKAFESEQTLENFIFNPQNVLFIDNDNH